jgi:hypothetical protein
MALNFGILQPANISGQLQAGQESAMRNQLAQQQLAAGQQQMETGRMQQEKAGLEMQQFRRRQSALDKFLSDAEKGGHTGDPEDVAKSFYNFALTSGEPPVILAAQQALMAAKERKQYIASRTPGAPAAAAPAGSEDRLGDFISQIEAKPMPMPAVTGGAPSPAANMLAPAAAPAAPVNALAAPAPAVANPAAALQAKIIDLQMRYPSGVAKPEIDMLKTQLTELLKQTDTQREMQGLGLPPTTEGFKQYKALSQPLSEFEKLLAMSNLSPAEKDNLRIKRLQKEAMHAPSPQQNVYAFTPASVEAQKQFVQAAADERKVLRNAPDTLTNIDAAIKLIPTASTFMGKGGEPLLAAASFLNNRLGFGISTQGVTDATVLRTRLFEGILDNLKKLDSQPSQEQQRVLSEALGNLGTDPAALEQILNRIGETVRSRVDRFNTDVTDAEARGVKFPFTPQIKLPAPKFAPGAAAAQIPGQGPAPAAVSNSVTLPDGRVKTFPNADAANQFKKAAGL